MATDYNHEQFGRRCESLSRASESIIVAGELTQLVSLKFILFIRLLLIDWI